MVTVIVYYLLLLRPAYGKVNINVDIQRIDRQLDSLRIRCESSISSSSLYEESINAINRCVSASCFNDVYGDTPLEDGEVDPVRNRLFTICTRKEIRVGNNKQRKQTTLIVD